jgi:hypothetical protein
MIAAMVAPSGRLSSLITAACLELAPDLPLCDFFEAAILARPSLPIESFTCTYAYSWPFRDSLVVASMDIVLPPPQPRGPNGAGGEKPEVPGISFVGQLLQLFLFAGQPETTASMTTIMKASVIPRPRCQPQGLGIRS